MQAFPLIGRHGGLRATRRAAVVAALLVALTRTAGAQDAPTGASPRDAGAPAVVGGALTAAAPEKAAAEEFYLPDLTHWLPRAGNRESLSATVQILVVVSLLTILPSVILMMTSFTRMVIVLALVRQAVGTQALPPSQVVVGLAFFMTLLVMAPTLNRIRSNALDPYLAGKLPQMEAVQVAAGELRTFMFEQIKAGENEQDVYLFSEYALQRSIPASETLDERDVPMTALVPAFILGELKTAFVIGFRIYLPFLVIDMVIATVLVAMGMMMLPPVLVSLPFKLLLFVLADGWHLVAGSLAASVAQT